MFARVSLISFTNNSINEYCEFNQSSQIRVTSYDVSSYDVTPKAGCKRNVSKASVDSNAKSTTGYIIHSLAPGGLFF